MRSAHGEGCIVHTSLEEPPVLLHVALDARPGQAAREFVESDEWLVSLGYQLQNVPE